MTQSSTRIPSAQKPFFFLLTLPGSFGILNRRGHSHRKKAATQNARICDKGANEGTWRAGAEEAPAQKRKLKGQIHNWI